MKAHVGDEVIIQGHRVGEPERHGEIVEVRGPDGGSPFLVRWDDTGHTTLLFPGSDCVIKALSGRP
jgi:hypothetical protein